MTPSPPRIASRAVRPARSCSAAAAGSSPATARWRSTASGWTRPSAGWAPAAPRARGRRPPARLASGPLSVNQTAFVSCSAGKHLLGTGYEVFNAGGRVVVDDLTPNPTLTAVSVGAREVQGGSPENWTLTGYALC